MSSIPRLLLSSAGSFVLAVGTWVAGLFAGELTSFRSTTEICGGDISRPITQHALPLVNRCTFADGTTRELVPMWVNPIVFAGLAGGVALLALAIRAAHRQSSVTDNPGGTA